ncbi:elongation of very long chain fatty acids protein 7-like [Oppia nitens]|uniref:elongation of very long chain fatty acids protein 7-like n=1 Tax=Oppia nitens TaxID=1686743 RepID=UPI0023DB65B8|nr:elongation of very long chain fatty acids protein 7-like [Oppia nitens]
MNTSVIESDIGVTGAVVSVDLNNDLSINSVKYFLYDYWIRECDPRTRHHFLTRNGPERCLLVMIFWLLFVIRWGPDWMRNRKPMNLRTVMLAYNTFMVAVNAYFFYRALHWLNFGRRLWEFEFPERNDNSPSTLALIDEHVLYSYTKFIDLMDTVFFVLRKKDRHLSFLHLYHHFTVPVLAWVVMKIAPTVVPIGVFAALNTFVHTFMYAYYALSAFGPQMQRYLWWKHYITIAQILQFAILIIYGIFNIFLSNGYPIGLYWTGMLTNFY